jgi:hypothetical protein
METDMKTEPLDLSFIWPENGFFLVEGRLITLPQLAQLRHLSAVEKWAFGTDPDDVDLRTELYGYVDHVRVRAALAEMFPEGTAKAEIRRRLEIPPEVSHLGIAPKMTAVQQRSKFQVIDEIVVEVLEIIEKNRIIDELS